MAGVFTLLPVELSLCWGVAGAVWAGAPGFVHPGSMLAVGEQLELSDVFIQHESFLSLPAAVPFPPVPQRTAHFAAPQAFLFDLCLSCGHAGRSKHVFPATRSFPSRCPEGAPASAPAGASRGAELPRCSVLEPFHFTRREAKAQ